MVARQLFAYDPVADRYRCPAGHPLSPQGSPRTAHPADAIIYRASPRDGASDERVRAQLRTHLAKCSLRRRLSWAETPMAELKEHHGCGAPSIAGGTRC